MSVGLPDPLDAARILAALSSSVRERIKNLEVTCSIDSTNAALASRPNPPLGHGEVLLAEYQTAGRGRRGRSWLAPPGSAVCLSFSWTFPHVPRHAGALSLAVGVCAIRALKSQGVSNVQLKWPNDILIADRKLGGVLTEMQTEPRGVARVVIGIGVNVSLGAVALEEASASGLAATDLISESIAAPSRNSIATSLVEELIPGVMRFERMGFSPFVEEWRHVDALQARTVVVHVSDEGIQGIARGIDADGALLVETAQGMRKFLSGDVTVRPVT
jgi:BirA family transcriptional regulator, biotin operon repressor / biotin---[acetyl-CoA-carboxylase] ligase